jgi:hypothetical protein
MRVTCEPRAILDQARRLFEVEDRLFEALFLTLL